MPRIGVGVGIGRSYGTGGGLVLPYNPVLIIGPSDSNGTGSAGTSDDAAAAAAYAANPRIFTANQTTAGQFSQYAPGTITGMNNWSNTPKIGLELGFIEAFAAKYPNNSLYIIKLGRAGATMTRGTATGTFTGSIAANVMTKTAGADPAVNELIVGDGTVPFGAVVNAPKIASTEWYMSKIGQTAALSATAASQTLTRYAATASLSPDEGTLWPGLAGSISNGYRARSVNALAAVPGTKKIVATINLNGTNDKVAASNVYLRYQNDATVLSLAQRANWGLDATVPQIWARVRGSDAGSLSVRSQQAAMVAADPQLQLMDMDGYAVWDSTHFTIASLKAIGAEVFARAAF